jgi:hypothetical protein
MFEYGKEKLHMRIGSILSFFSSHFLPGIITTKAVSVLLFSFDQRPSFSLMALIDGMKKYSPLAIQAVRVPSENKTKSSAMSEVFQGGGFSVNK